MTESTFDIFHHAFKPVKILTSVIINPEAMINLSVNPGQINFIRTLVTHVFKK